MCSHISLKKIYIFLSAFLIGIFAVATYQILNSNTKTQNLLTDENVIVFNRQPQKIEEKNEPSGFSGESESESNSRTDCLNYCRVCNCEINSSYKRSKVSETEIIESANLKPLKIVYKPKPKYTEEAKANNIEGNVRLRVTFLPSGNIGSVNEVAGLSFGLTEKAIEAAKKIKFKPQTVNGKPVAVTKVVAYTFTIY